MILILQKISEMLIIFHFKKKRRKQITELWISPSSIKWSEKITQGTSLIIPIKAIIIGVWKSWLLVSADKTRAATSC